MSVFDTDWITATSMSKSGTYVSNDGPTSPQLSHDTNPPLSQPSHQHQPLAMLRQANSDLQLYYVIQYAGPLILVVFLILGMYSRRYSPLSSTSTTGEKHSKSVESSSSSSHNKSLDEIVDTLAQLTSRCNILLDPFLAMTDFLSTQRTPTSATTRPALTTLFIRILLVSPAWIALTLPPLYILTPRRVILFTGTTILTWHSRPARVTRVLLWRSLFLRRLAALITGLSFPDQALSPPTNLPLLHSSIRHPPLRAPDEPPLLACVSRSSWLGWTTSLFSYERGPWTDEHLNHAPSRDEFELPEVDGGVSKWRWVEGSDWRIERGDAKQHARNSSTGSRTGPAGSSSSSGSHDGSDGGGWIYYDNKWEDGRLEDGWGRYTRRRKWYRDAELVEATPSPTPNNDGARSEDDSEASRIRRAKEYASKIGKSPATTTPLKTALSPTSPTTPVTSTVTPGSATATATETPTTPSTAKRRSGWFSSTKEKSSTPTTNAGGEQETIRNRAKSDARSTASSSITKNTMLSGGSNRSRDGPEDDHVDRWREQQRGFSVAGDDLSMGLS
ncbi:Peroxisomal membrane protein PEX30 [Cyphellophora attinorum]|uniref:Peroxisomal membrane protein PEX30 n=1 Tax=Cyphellophora attinorum TaxID=1664694 RepID=A0A0N0NPQ4_9EURO|nr:Peroxisomal membrane protein PEX30 [Phialophora attinorum]KPI43021.1 Peroxisomal membrane protein PEX30 [Phialophora attinorum]